MLHALGKDILALEVGTNSNTTYRSMTTTVKEKMEKHVLYMLKNLLMSQTSI